MRRRGKERLIEGKGRNKGWQKAEMSEEDLRESRLWVQGLLEETE